MTNEIVKISLIKVLAVSFAAAVILYAISLAIFITAVKFFEYRHIKRVNERFRKQKEGFLK